MSRECAVPMCGEDGAQTCVVCENDHRMHIECISNLVRAAMDGLDDGETSSRLRCPLCRSESVFAAWKTAFSVSIRETPVDADWNLDTAVQSAIQRRREQRAAESIQAMMIPPSNNSMATAPRSMLNIRLHR